MRPGSAILVNEIIGRFHRTARSRLFLSFTIKIYPPTRGNASRDTIRIEERGQIRFNSGSTKLKFSPCHRIREIENWRERLLASSFKFSKGSKIVTFHRFSIGEAITQEGVSIFPDGKIALGFGMKKREKERWRGEMAGWTSVRQIDTLAEPIDSSWATRWPRGTRVRSASRRIEISSGENRFRTCVTFTSENFFPSTRLENSNKIKSHDYSLPVN